MVADTIPNVFDYDAPAMSQQLLGGSGGGQHGMTGMTGIQMDAPQFGNVSQNLHPMTHGQGVDQIGTQVSPMNMHGNGNGFGYGMGFSQTPMHQVQVPQCHQFSQFSQFPQFPQFPQAPQLSHMHQLPPLPQMAHLPPRQMIPTGMGFNSNNNISNMSNHFHNPNVHAPCCNCGHFAVSTASAVSAVSAPSASIAPMSENYGYYGPTRGSSSYSIQPQNNDFQFFDNLSCNMNSVFSPSVSQIGGIGSSIGSGIGSSIGSNVNQNVNMNINDMNLNGMNLNGISGFDNGTVANEAMNINNGNITIGTFSLNNINDQFTTAATVVSDVSHSSNGSSNHNGSSSINTTENENMNMNMNMNNNENHNGNSSIVDDTTVTGTGTAATANMGIELDEISPPIVNEDASSVVAVAEEDKMSQFDKELKLNKSMGGFDDDDDIFNGEAASGFMDDMSMMGGIMGGFNFDMESINSGF